MRFVQHNPDDIGWDIIVKVGQSNNDSFALPYDPLTDPIDPDVWQYGAQGTYGNIISVAQEPLAFPDAPSASGTGNSVHLARWYLKSVPRNRRVLVVPAAYGGTSLASQSNPNNWHPASVGSLADKAIAQANAAIAAAGSNSRIVAIFWIQGEADSNANATTYASLLDTLFGRFRNEITGASTVPIVVGQMVPDYIAATTGLPAINDAHIQTARRLNRVSFAYGPSNMHNTLELIHYSAAGQRVMGKRMFDALRLAQSNVTGVAPTAPVPPTAVQAGTTLTVTWTRPYCRFTDFNVRYRSNGGAWQTLTRAQSVDNTATITGLTLGAAVDFQVATVNEQGTSAWSPIGSFTLVTLPDQVTGVTVTTPGSTSLPVSWTAAARATQYLIEYKKSSDSTWSTGPTVTTTTGTITVLSSAVSYDIRVTSQNGAGNGTVSTTYTVSTAAAPTLTDVVGVSPYRAYSLRKVGTAAYAGKAILLRRSSDNTTQQIGFTASGDFDAATAATFVGSGDGYIVTWYDQSGNGRDVTQATAANQAKVYAAGVLNTLGGRAAALGNGSTTWYSQASVGLYAAGATSSLCVYQHAAIPTSNQALWSEASTTTSATARYIPGVPSGVSGQAAQSYTTNTVTDDSNASVLGGISGYYTGTNANQSSMVDNGSSITQYVNGVTGQTTPYSRSGHTLTLNVFSLMANALNATARYYFNGSTGEVVLFAAALTDAQRVAGQSNQRNYFSTV